MGARLNVIKADLAVPMVLMAGLLFFELRMHRNR